MIAYCLHKTAIPRKKAVKPGLSLVNMQSALRTNNNVSISVKMNTLNPHMYGLIITRAQIIKLSFSFFVYDVTYRYKTKRNKNEIISERILNSIRPVPTNFPQAA